MDKEELKGIIWPTLLTVILFSSFVLFVWPNTDMYKAEKAYQRLQAQTYMIETFYFTGAQVETSRAEIMARYDFADEDINPVKLLRSFNHAD